MLEWLDAEGLDVRPGNTWVKQFLRGMRCVRAPQSCSTGCQYAPALHQAVLADGRARCQRRPHRRDVLPALVGASDRSGPPRREAGPAAGKHEGGQDVHGRDMLVQIVHAGKTDVVLPEQPWLEGTYHVTSENGWATTTTILQLAATLDDVMN